MNNPIDRRKGKVDNASIGLIESGSPKIKRQLATFGFVVNKKGNPKYNRLLEELEFLRRENAQLRVLLCSYGVPHKAHTELPELSAETLTPANAQSRTAEKIAIFRSLFQGRTDIYPLRWESAKGKAGYSPACGNEWRPGICYKP